MAHWQEQESADTQISEVAPNVLRMQLPIRMPGLGHVNMYALLDKNGAAVIDPGLPGPFTWQAIQDRLQQAGLKPKDIHTVLITHSHPDHFGGAQRFVKEHGASVIAHRSFRFGLAKSALENQPEVSVEDLDAQRHSEEGGEEDGSPSPDHAPGAAGPGQDHDGHGHSHGAQSAMGWWGGPTPWGGARPRASP
ncbi:MAG: MBL fold metallo-hydrolase [Pseudomonadales bacterium]|nr:MBL fold metallo-hydrolase [Pseudomonadales bacterium]